MSQGRFEIVKTGPEGEGEQPYFLRLVGGNGAKIVHSETYAHRSGAEGAYVTLARTLLALEAVPDLEVSWRADGTTGYLLGNGWMVSHTPIYLVTEEPARPPAKKTAARKIPAKKTAKMAASPLE